MKTSAKMFLLCSLYLCQGLPYGFFTQALPALMRSQGLSLPAISLTSLLAAPWAFKFLWAPLVDRWSCARIGPRRTWILPLQLAAVALLAALAGTDPVHGLPWLLAGVFAINLIAATQDIATDALALDLLCPRERGLGNGIQVAGYRAGMIIGGGVLLIAFHHLGWALSFLFMSVLLLVATWPIFRHREQPRQRVQATAPTKPGWAAIAGGLRRPEMRSWLGVLVTYKAGEHLATGMLRPFLVDAGFDLARIGWLLGTVGFTAGLFGAIAGGWAVTRLGRTRALLGFGLLQAFTVGAYVLPAAGIGGQFVLYAVCTLEHIAGGMATAALFTIMMDLTRSHAAATEYTLQASVVVIASGAAAALSGLLAQAVGYPAHFAVACAACLAGVILAWRHRTRERHCDKELRV